MQNNPVSEKEKISLALKISLQKEQALAKKYADLAQSITDPSLQKHLQVLEQTSRNHLYLVNQQIQQQNSLRAAMWIKAGAILPHTSILQIIEE